MKLKTQYVFKMYEKILSWLLVQNTYKNKYNNKNKIKIKLT